MPTVAVDFDGVISAYTGWKGKGIFAAPVAGCKDMLDKLREEGWVIIVHTTRSETDQIITYLAENQIPYDYINYNPKNVEQGLNQGKPLADVYIDDRAIRFGGNWDENLLNAIHNSDPWWRKKGDVAI